MCEHIGAHTLTNCYLFPEHTGFTTQKHIKYCAAFMSAWPIQTQFNPITTTIKTTTTTVSHKYMNIEHIHNKIIIIIITIIIANTLNGESWKSMYLSTQ